MHLWRLYGRFLNVYMKQQLEYRFSFFGDLFVNAMMYVTMYAGFWVLFRPFDNIDGWTFYEVVFLYNLNLFTYGASSLFFWGPMKQLENYIRSGEFDSFLTRPLHPLTFMVFRQFQHTFLGHIVVSTVVFAICADRLELHWTLLQVLTFFVMIVGGILIQAGIIITSASSAFWFVRSSSIVDASIYSIRGYINYPLTIYGDAVRILLSFVLPYAFINYYPSSSLLGKEGAIGSAWTASVCSLLIGVCWVGVALLLFNRGMKRYESTGS